MMDSSSIPTIDPALTRDAYHAILEIGMENLQRFRVRTLFDYLAIEIDHLHNLPHYMREENVYIHAYYLCTTKPFYIERIVPITGIDSDHLVSRYAPHWESLRDALSPFANAINARHYTDTI